MVAQRRPVNWRAAGMKLAWLADYIGEDYIGGAEISSEALCKAAPEQYEVIPVRAGDYAALGEADAVVIHNCVHYGPDLIPHIERKPVLKWVHDVWPHGDPVLREWLLQNSRVVVFMSRPHYSTFPYPVGTKAELVPDPIDLAAFRAAAAASTDRRGILWLGTMHENKGLSAAVSWAWQYRQHVDFYGDGPLRPKETEYTRYCGVVPPADVPRIMAQYERFLFIPFGFEPFGRTVIEAWAAGCRLMINQNIGALWWLENDPQALETATADAWKVIERFAR